MNKPVRIKLLNPDVCNLRIMKFFGNTQLLKLIVIIIKSEGHHYMIALIIFYDLFNHVHAQSIPVAL